jgi:hypothetical protein
MVASPRPWETVARIADCINAIRFELPSLLATEVAAIILAAALMRPSVAYQRLRLIGVSLRATKDEAFGPNSLGATGQLGQPGRA